MKLNFTKMSKQIRENERGQVLVLVLVVSVLIFGSAMLAIDMATYVRERQKLEIAVDAAALAGGLELPDSGTAARAKALEYIGVNDPDVADEDVLTTFRCLVGDRNGDGQPDSADIPAVCDPGSGNPFECEEGLCVSWCEFTGDNRCNVLAVDASKNVDLYFTNLLGLPPVTISASRTGACKGLCGSAPNVPLDVIIVIDRSGSMSYSELSDAKDGALAVLEIFDPEFQHVGLAVLGAGDPDDPCDDQDPYYGGNWLVVPLSDDYKDEDGSLNMGSDLVSTISCLNNSSQGTNLGSPLSDSFYDRPDALTELMNSGREDVEQGIIFMTDGAANEPDPMPGPDNPCEYANDRATVVKNADVEIFTIGYGIQSEHCNDDSGPYDYERVTELLADMATDSADDQGHCDTTGEIDAENNDGDHFLCQAKGSDLEIVFVTAAESLVTGIRLIGYP
jgi:hypothetical protein